MEYGMEMLTEIQQELSAFKNTYFRQSNVRHCWYEGSNSQKREKEKEGIVSFTIELALFSPANQDFIHTFNCHHSYLKPQDTISLAFLCEFALCVILYCMQEQSPLQSADANRHQKPLLRFLQQKILFHSLAERISKEKQKLS